MIEPSRVELLLLFAAAAAAAAAAYWPQKRPARAHAEAAPAERGPEDGPTKRAAHDCAGLKLGRRAAEMNE